MDQLIKLIDNFPEVDGMLYGDIDLYDNDEYFKGYDLKLVDQQGGEEQGSNIYSVFRVNNDKFIMVYGFYQSFIGAEYEGCKEVTAKTKIVTYYD